MSYFLLITKHFFLFTVENKWTDFSYLGEEDQIIPCMPFHIKYTLMCWPPTKFMIDVQYQFFSNFGYTSFNYLEGFIFLAAQLSYKQICISQVGKNEIKEIFLRVVITFYHNYINFLFLIIVTRLNAVLKIYQRKYLPVQEDNIKVIKRKI